MRNFIPQVLTIYSRKTFICAASGAIIFFAAASNLLGQSATPATQELEQVLEFLAQASVSVPSLDVLEYYHRYPLRLKNASVRDLQTLPAISLETAIAIKRLMKRLPDADYTMLQDSLALSFAQVYVLKFCTVLENAIREVEDVRSGDSIPPRPYQISQTTIPAQSRPPKSRTPQSRVEPLPTLPSLTNAAIWYRARTRLWATPQRGFTPDASQSQQFQGTPLELYQRLTASLRVDSVGFFEANITAAKDAGELSVADFLSAYIRAEFGSAAQRTSIVAGDFLVESGAGTAFWSLYGAGKSAEVIAPATQVNVNLLPYRSSTEQQFYRGVALRHDRQVSEKLSLRLVGWGSWQTRAARLDTVRDVITSVDATGLFRTRSELALRGNLQEQVYGVSAEVRSQEQNGTNIDGMRLVEDSGAWSWSIGAGVQYLNYDKQVVSRSVMVFPLQQGAIASVFGTLSSGQSVLAAEISRDGMGNIGGRLGAEMRMDGWEFAAVARAFPTEFRSPFGVNFGENSKPTNEAGLYVGAVWKRLPNVRVNAYADVYTTISSTATIPVPVRGVDVFTETTWRILRDVQVVMRLRHETKTDELTLGTGRNSRNIVYGRGRTGLRLHGQWECADNLRLQARYEAAYVSYEGNKDPEWGMLGFLGASWSPFAWASLTGRMVAYRTASFDSALWQYETAIAGTLSNPALFGQGLRGYVMLELQPWQNIIFSTRGSVTRRFDVGVIGSGATQINSNTDAQLVMQVDVRF
ncbi:MAG: hypothetical protein ACOVSW_05270 [Candidatus Kapaibacteriota bacterium]